MDGVAGVGVALLTVLPAPKMSLNTVVCANAEDAMANSMVWEQAIRSSRVLPL